MVNMKKRGRGKCEWQGRVPMQMRIPTTTTKMASNTSSHPGSLFQFLLPKELALDNCNRVRFLGESIALMYTKVASLLIP